MSQYALALDVGGTFTDVIMVEPGSGALWTTKTPSTPADPSEGFFDGVEKVLGRAGAALELCRVLLEWQGPRCVPQACAAQLLGVRRATLFLVVDRSGAVARHRRSPGWHLDLRGLVGGLGSFRSATCRAVLGDENASGTAG